MSKILKGWSMVKYLVVIVVVSIVFGLITDVLYEFTGLEAIYASGQHTEQASTFAFATAAALLILICYYSGRKLARRFS